jgi:hypothetical protein
VSRLASEIAQSGRDLASDYRAALLQVHQPSGGRPQVWIPRREGDVSDPTGETVAEREHKLKALAIGADKFDQALKMIREAHGHIHRGMDKKEAKGSSWPADDLASIEAEYRDKKRGKR